MIDAERDDDGTILIRKPMDKGWLTVCFVGDGSKVVIVGEDGSGKHISGSMAFDRLVSVVTEQGLSR